MKIKAVFHVDQNDEAVFNLALTNIVNFLAKVPPEKSDIVLVVNGPGVKLLPSEKITVFIDKINQLAESGVRMQACGNALKAMDIRPDALNEHWAVIPAGVVQVIQLQHEGYAYVKP